MSILDESIARLDGTPGTLRDLTAGQPALLVNVASKCGLTPQYAKLEQLEKDYADNGFTVVGFPCNQFNGQEPGSADEIAQFCSATYGVTFPLSEKVEVNGAGRHPIYRALIGDGADIEWNFAKFLIDADGNVVARFGSRTEPDAPEVVTAIQQVIA
ncbi:glutathione peroxidase [Branchiibius hedensis]|uniref:Glutathione peroxidase n=1 Tax=Branchiibius hedensis TaxID=672460 RepID=A0A2Y8ZP45_9MICO|nr:glutathione peroxidase [Branchiibius hedensis]PWJ24271.1 glutathione peroxidase [Branchiibius hedensis]SSA33088.1 glutathione peroxidase [Branchiibius hedensis]